MIKFRNVTKTYGEVVALKNISFEIDKGEFVFITGPSGSGKTTILKLILGEIVPDAGEVWFNNINIANAKTIATAKFLVFMTCPPFRAKISQFILSFFPKLPQTKGYE